MFIIFPLHSIIKMASKSRLSQYENAVVLASKDLQIKNDDENDNDTTTDSETDDDEDDDDAVDDNCDNINKMKSNTILELPGGTSTTNNINLSTFEVVKNCKGSIGSRSVGELPREITYFIRQYMDCLFGAVILQAHAAAQRNNFMSYESVPGIVAEILSYNNIIFQDVSMIKTKLTLHEPIWYRIDIQRSSLTLYLDENLYDNMCMRLSDLPVSFDGGMISLDIFNPFRQNPILPPTISSAMISCAIMCDHVAQHIITDIFSCQDKNSLKNLPDSHLHTEFTKYGTTMHSMFSIERNVMKRNRKEYANHLTFYDNTNFTRLLHNKFDRDTQQISSSKSKTIIESILNSIN